MPPKIVLLSPNNYSLYSLCVAEELRTRGSMIAGIVCIRLLNGRRFLREMKRDGFAWVLKKFWHKVLFRESKRKLREFETLSDRKRQRGLHESSLKAWAQARQIPFLMSHSFDEPDVLKAMALWQPDLSVFTGGGLVRRSFIESSGRGVLNCHAGILPHYRGMNVVEWPILEGRKDLVGITTHLMDDGIDTGPILRTRPIAFQSNESCSEIRERFPTYMIDQIVGDAVDFLQGDLEPQAQVKTAGRQYYVMHPALLAIAERLSRQN